MEIKLINLDKVKKDKKYFKALELVDKVKLDYKTDKHISFIVENDNRHNVMYFSERKEDNWQCDCKWYTLQNKICSHIIAVNLAIKNNKIKIS